MKRSRRRFLDDLLRIVLLISGSNLILYCSKKNDPLKRTYKASKKVLKNNFGKKKSETIFKKAILEYMALKSKLPYIGGESNMNHVNLLYAAYFLGMYRVLLSKKQTIEQIGKIIFETYEAFGDYSGWLISIYGFFKYGIGYKDKLKKQAALSQKRKYPDDWVFAYIEGDGKEFDYGLDFSECGICKFYKSQNAEELIPYMCISDYVISKIFNRGLIRYKTLAEGYDKCDFRYKDGRKTFLKPLRDGWPPKFKKKQG